MEVGGVFVAEGNGKNGGAQDSGQQMGDPVGTGGVRNRLSEPLGDAERTIGWGEKHDPAIGTDPPAVKGGGDPLVADGWKAERAGAVHAGRRGRAVARQDPPGLRTA